jgi:hypothetical protein
MSDLEANAGGSSWIAGFYNHYLRDPDVRANFLIVAAPALALAMVSNIVYRSHKALKMRAIKPFKLLSILTFLIALLAYQPEAVGFTFCFLYALSGPFEWALGWKKATEDDEIFSPQEDDDDDLAPGTDHEDGGVTPRLGLFNKDAPKL